MHRIDFRRLRDLPSSDPEAFRATMRRLASGVTIVTAASDAVVYGITVSAFSSISVEPPIVMVSIGNDSPLAPLIVEVEHYAVNLLASDQEELARRFAEPLPGEEKYRDLPIRQGSSGAPWIDGSIAVVDCVLDQTLEVGTHTLMFGRVVATHLPERELEPLLYFNQSYHALGEESRLGG